MTNGSGNVVESYTYDSFGKTHPSSNFRNSYAYTGREWDKETGLYYYRARYYDPMEGRFLSKDPISFDGGDPNLYGYVGNNSTNLIDPTGLKASDWFFDKFTGRNKPSDIAKVCVKALDASDYPVEECGKCSQQIRKGILDFTGPGGYMNTCLKLWCERHNNSDPQCGCQRNDNDK